VTKRYTWWSFCCLALAACQSASEPPPLTREQLLNPESCKDCHPKHYREWSGSMHAYASKDPVFRAMNKRGQEETKGELGEFCVNCHAPMAVREHAISDLSNLDSVPEPLQGVTCFFCHNAASVGAEHVNANITLADDNIMRAALNNALEPTAHRVQFSANHSPSKLESSIMCGTCHDINTPAGVRLERTLEEYQASIFAQGDKPQVFQSCQDCHMRGSNRTQPAADSTGRDGEIVKARTVHEHLWAAVDVPLSDFPHAQALRSAVETCELQNSISYFTVAPSPAPGFPFTVTLETDAGHMQPSGAAQDRRLWLEAIAYDENGKELARQGVVGDGEVEETAEKKHVCMFRDRIRDADGNEVHMFWEAASHDKDARLLKPLPIGGALSPGSHAVDCPFNLRLTQQPARIALKLRMRPMGIDVLEDLVKSGHLAADVVKQMPTFTVASYEARFDASGFEYRVLRDPSEGDCSPYRCMLDPSAINCN
jgi:hypothetical protein